MLHLLNHWFKHCRCRTCMKLHMFHGVYDRLVMCFSTSYDSSNKKFELMLTGRAKAYSSFCPQAVTHCSTNRARRRVTSFQPKRLTNDATPPMPAPWRRLVNDFASSPKLPEKSIKNPYFGVQGHPKSLNSAPIESQYTISY